MDDIGETELADEPAEEPGRVTDADEIDRDLQSMSRDAQELIDALLDDDRLRVIVRYDGDDPEVVYARDDVTDGFTEPELATRVQTFVMQGLSEPDHDGALYDFGGLDATVRWYEEAVVAQFPVDEWTGLVFTFDRSTESLTELARKLI